MGYHEAVGRWPKNTDAQGAGEQRAYMTSDGTDGQPLALARADLPRFALFGLVAALHFLFYIGSLSFTTVAHSLSLVYTAPVFVAVLAALLLRQGDEGQ